MFEVEPRTQNVKLKTLAERAGFNRDKGDVENYFELRI